MSGAALGTARQPVLELRHVAKRFGSVLANDDVDFAAAAGTIHALVGENGAGKTTAMRIAFGLLAPDRGEVAVDGTPRRFAGPRDAVRLGIGMVHQHFALVDAMTVTENVVLGAEPGSPWAIDLAAASVRVAALARELGLPIDPAARAGELSVAERQRAELLKALYRQARVLILDEPTAVLAPHEVAALFAVLRRMRDQGRTVVLITHRLAEVLAVADEVTVMRDGRVVATRTARDLGTAELARLIVGRRAAGNAAPCEAPPRRAVKSAARPGAPVLAVRGLTVAAAGVAGGRPRLDGVSFDVRAGEILGVAGVEGNGQTELIEALAGLGGPAAGDPGAAAGRVGGGRRSGGIGSGPSGRVMLAVADPASRMGAARRASEGAREAQGTDGPEKTEGAQQTAAAEGAARAESMMDLAGAGARRRRELGIAHIPEDGHRRGLVLDLDLAENSILGVHRRPPAAIGPWRAWLDLAAIARRAATILARFEVRPAVVGMRAGGLSGGNQQKLVVGRELSPPPRLLLAAQPTRGVDLGGSALIHRQILALRDGGCAVLLVSSELEELMALADRLLILHRGRVAGELDPARSTVEQVGLLMTGEASG